MNISKVRYLALKREVYLLDLGKCHICRKPVEEARATLDHIIPNAVASMIQPPFTSLSPGCDRLLTYSKLPATSGWLGCTSS